MIDIVHLALSAAKREDVPDAVDCVLGVEDHFAFGNVLVEALSIGLPVVATDCPNGPREILQNGRYGPLVSIGDKDALSRAIEDTLIILCLEIS